jgi:hypothetical protein
MFSVQAVAAPAPDHGELSRILNWLACWIVLPNLPFLPITLMGGPMRAFEIAVCGIVGLLARRLPVWMRRFVFVGLMAYLVVVFIAHMFNMAPSMILLVIGLVTDIQPAVSPEYVAGTVLVGACLATGLWLLKSDAGFSDARFVAAAGATIILLAGLDVWASRETMGSYTRLAPDDAPFTSAAQQSGLLQLADGKTNVMVVMVEAMGMPRDPHMRSRLDQIWIRPEFASRFEITQGKTAFFGSTTSGEMRELCGRWGDYGEIRAPQPNCLPATLAAKGYRTTSYHAFTSSFFDRPRWYPLIGIERSYFRDDLLAMGASFCPNVFAGACDRDVPRIIGEQLKDSTKPQFIYWLTLNSHLPVIEDSKLRTTDCKQLGGRADADFPVICRMYSVWDDTAAALAEMVSQPGFPPTDILIVGDHMPPFTHQKSRLQFDSEHVPWILLKHRDQKDVVAVQPQRSSGRPAA